METMTWIDDLIYMKNNMPLSADPCLLFHQIYKYVTNGQ